MALSKPLYERLIKFKSLDQKEESKVIDEEKPESPDSKPNESVKPETATKPQSVKPETAAENKESEKPVTASENKPETAVDAA